jgi:hypothetical protein
VVCGTPCRGTVALFRKLLLTLSVVTSEAYQCITFAARARLPSTIMRVQDTQFEDNALAIAFGSPILCVRLGDALPQGTLEALAEDVLSSWGDYIDAREQLGDKDLNADFFFYQSTVYGDTDHCRSTPPANPRAWMAGVAGQEVIKAVTAAASSYIERVGFHATGDAEATKLTPNNMHMVMPALAISPARCFRPPTSPSTHDSSMPGRAQAHRRSLRERDSPHGSRLIRGDGSRDRSGRPCTRTGAPTRSTSTSVPCSAVCSTCRAQKAPARLSSTIHEAACRPLDALCPTSRVRETWSHLTVSKPPCSTILGR